MALGAPVVLLFEVIYRLSGGRGSAGAHFGRRIGRGEEHNGDELQKAHQQESAGQAHDSQAHSRWYANVAMN